MKKRTRSKKVESSEDESSPVESSTQTDIFSRQESEEEDGNDEEDYQMDLDDALTQTRTQMELQVDHALSGSRFQRLPDEEEVRSLRNAYAQLLNEVKDHKTELIMPDSTRLGDLIGNANKLLNRVHTTVDATLDSRFVAITAGLGAEKINKLASGAVDFSLGDFCTLLKTALEKSGNQSGLLSSAPNHNRQANPLSMATSIAEEEDEDRDTETVFDWGMIGDFAAHHWRGVHTPDFMLGVIDLTPPEKQVKTRAPREKRVEAPVEQPTIIDSKTSTGLNVPGNGLSETTKNVVLLAEVLQRLGPTPLFAFITDPDSFAKTVENLYYVAFLISENRIKLLREDDDIIIYLIENDEDGDVANAPRLKHQAILPMTMRQWRENIQKYKLKKALINT